MNRRCYIIVLAAFLFRCESGVEIENIPTEKLFSVTAFISPQDTMFIAYVYKARELNSVSIPDSALVDDALVVISNGHSSDTLVYRQGSGRYEIPPKNISIQPGETYFLRVLPVYGDPLTASCTVPPSPPVPDITGKMANNDFLFDVSWHNSSGFEFFALSTNATGTYEFEYPWGKRTQQLTARITDDIFFPANNQSEYNVYSGIVPSANIAVNPKLMVTLRNIDSNLFRYFDTYRRYQNWDANNTGNLYPNFQEPLPLFSNIDGGVGIFGAYNQSTVEVDL